ncbi:CAF17-like 4Fe-4S cluster assembly/insertion protein YgfZ [Agromyces atrinae]|uniref:Folate-binding protein n=2 Tax=Agromyces atrinae TaxID=592376 RepID=A0A4Q2M5J0_9MICO|nr:folate-binding protein [Agromyces atrinae]
MMTDSPLLAVPGAVAADGIDAGVASHYGNPLVEQRRLEEGLALVDLSNRGVLSVTGPDRLTWLDSMASQSLARLQPGDSAEALFLDASGRVEHAVHLVDDGETAWLVLEASSAEPLRAWLDRMRFMLRVAVADVSAETAVIGSLGAPLPDGVAVTAIWNDPWAHVAPGGFQYAAESGHPSAEWGYSETLVPRADLSVIARAARAGDVTLAGSLALEALRIAAWRPRFATEVDERTIPHELDWLRSAVHLSKGCYRGQETVAKVHNLGRPPRRLVLLHLDGSDTVLPVHGDIVSADKVRPESEAERRAVGVVTSSALHHELGPIALAVVKRAVPSDIPFTIDSHETEVAAAQVEIVPSGAGAQVDVPRLPRLGIRR